MKATLCAILAATPIAILSSCTPAAESPAGGSGPSSSASESTKLADGPRIVGSVTLSATEKPSTVGGVVYLEDAPKQPGVATTATIEVHRKAFRPFITVVTTGASVTFGNKEPLAHHVFSPDMKELDTGFLKQDETAVRKFDTTGVFPLLCNVHPEMLAYLLVIPSTYFGQVGTNGEYVIPNVPPGTYKATAWAPRIPTVTQSVTVGPSGAVTANFVLKPAP
jgi:plastocyanin